MFNDNVLNPGLAGTYKFIERVLDEVCELFPGTYIHIGADEIPEGAWLASPACQKLMQQHSYMSALDLQGHLLRHVQCYLARKDRTLLGWEEAAHGGKLHESAIICAWSGKDSVAKAASGGYKIIACPAPYAYLDIAWNDDWREPGLHWAGTADLAACYHYQPVSADIEAKVVGVQAVLWSELITTPARLEYMLWPRLLAVAESAWFELDTKDWESFRARTAIHLERLAQNGINYRPIDDV
jgi:hexosaminidase